MREKCALLLTGYAAELERVETLCRDQQKQWAHRAILDGADSEKFSSDQANLGRRTGAQIA